MTKLRQFFAFIWKIIFIITFFILFTIHIPVVHNQVDEWYSLSTARGFHRVALWLKENSNKNDIVLTDWQLGAQVVAHAKRPTVATCKVYPSEVGIVAKRYNDINKRFFDTKNKKTALNVARKYAVKYVLFRKRKPKKDTMLHQMLVKKKLDNFKLVYDSNGYMIYEVDLKGTESEFQEILDLLKSEISEGETLLTSLPEGEEIYKKLDRHMVAPKSQVRKDFYTGNAALILNNDDIIEFFFAKTEDDAMKIAKRYNIHFVLLERSPPRWFHPYDNEGYMESRSDRMTVKGNLITMFGKMRLGMKLNNFEPIYISDRYAVYKRKPYNVARHFTRDFGRENSIVSLFERNDIKRYPHIYGAIIPHSLESRKLAAELLQNIGENQNVKTLILIGPNHFALGKESIALSMYKWETPFGIIKPDENIADKLLKVKLIKIDESVHEGEHSIRALLPLVKYEFQRVRIVPLHLRGITYKDAILLGREIAKVMDENTVVIVSVDFSHGLPQDETLRHDKESASSIQAFEKEKIYSLRLDSKASVVALLECMEQIGAKEAKILKISNSGLLGRNKKESVGYVTAIFTK